ncbi:hypothetical protein DSM100685_1748 [Bifidobacterium avesanii]|nr:hypothetical protein DSM100685_1748 [Bifidobacterium avesanii]
MVSSNRPGRSGNNSTMVIIALITLAAYADRTWVTALLGLIVLYVLLEDRRNRK